MENVRFELDEIITQKMNVVSWAYIFFNSHREYNELKNYKQANACLRECQNNHKNEYWFYQNSKFLIVVLKHQDIYFVHYGVNLSLGVKK